MSEEVVRVVKYEVHLSTNGDPCKLWRDCATYEEAHHYLQRIGAAPRSIWRLHCYDDGNTTRCTRQLIVAFK